MEMFSRRHGNYLYKIVHPRGDIRVYDVISCIWKMLFYGNMPHVVNVGSDVWTPASFPQDNKDTKMRP